MRSLTVLRLIVCRSGEVAMFVSFVFTALVVWLLVLVLMVIVR
jgi:hypothetical protein